MNYPVGLPTDATDPRSPFYTQPPECEDCGEELTLDYDCDEDGIFTTATCLECNK
jgi:hypothetical protein